jgi:hypothetical protein
MYIIFGIVSMGFIMSNIFLPVFHNLQLTSTYHVSHPSLGLLN